jgi:RES domain-containing protein
LEIGVYEPSLLDLLETFPATAHHGQAWRIAFVGQEPLRANTRGARWNPKDVSALYTSLSAECVRAEFRYILDLQPSRPSQPALEYTLSIKLERVLDLSGAERLQQLGLDWEHPGDTLEGFKPFQTIGGAAASLGFEGMLVPSMRLVGGVNLVIYVDNVESVGVSEVQVISSRPFTMS